MAASEADDRRHTVLVFAPIGRDGPLTRELLERAAIDTLLCKAIDELCTALLADADAVILTEEALDDPSFSTLVEVLDRQPAWSDIPVLVFAGGEETRTSLRTLAVIDQLRNVTLIERPIRLAAVLSIVRSALRSRQRQYELRDVLLALHAARAEAEDASRMKDEFLATLSHELRTPLNAILGWTTMLRHGQVEAARVPKVLDVVDRNARAQAQLIEDVLDMARIITGKLRVDTKPLQLLPLVEAAIDSMGPAADAKGVTLALKAPASLPAVRGDANRLQQVFWNLISNAVKFTPAGGRAEVVVEREGANLRIDVGDTGAGLAAEFLPFVFDRFRQADQSVTRGHGGLGLGLAIVKHLIELHGGRVSVRSDGPGRGTTVTVLLPALSTASVASLPPARSDSDEAFGISLGGLSVLIVDDDDATRELLADMIRRTGAKAITAGDAVEAFARSRLTPPDLIVADVGLPHEDGCSLLRRLHAQPATAHTPAIALSAYARPEDRTAALQAGFTQFIAKPAAPQEVLLSLAQLAQDRHQHS